MKLDSRTGVVDLWFNFCGAFLVKLSKHFYCVQLIADNL